MKKKLLRGGFVVTPRGSRRADVLLDGEKIAQVGHISPAEAKKRRGDGRFRLLPLPRLHRRAHAL